MRAIEFGFGVSLAALAGCKDGDAACGDDATAAAGAGLAVLETRDGVCLIGDHFPGDAGAPGVVLLHMTPTSGASRADWSSDFIGALGDEGWHVLSLDRRGADASGGAPVDASEGPGGRYDVEAGALFLVDAGAGPLALVGASNGTTSLVDYAVWSEEENRTPVSAAALLSPGTYTENQPDMPTYAAAGVPTLFVAAEAEADWPAAQVALAPELWSLAEVPGAAHGTDLLVDAPEVTPLVTDALRGALAGR